MESISHLPSSLFEVGAQHAAPLPLVLFLDFFNPPLVPATLEVRFQPFVQDTDTLFFRDELSRQHKEVRIPMLARQLGYLLIPCQRRPYSGEAVGCIRHAQSCTTSEHSALHFPAAHRLRHRLGIVGIVVGRIELLRPHVDRFVPELFQLVYQPVLEIEAYMVCTHIDLFRHWSHLTPGTRHLTPAVQTKFCLTFAIAAILRSASRSAAL